MKGHTIFEPPWLWAQENIGIGGAAALNACEKSAGRDGFGAAAAPENPEDALPRRRGPRKSGRRSPPLALPSKTRKTRVPAAADRGDPENALPRRR